MNSNYHFCRVSLKRKFYKLRFLRSYRFLRRLSYKRKLYKRNFTFQFIKYFYFTKFNTYCIKSSILAQHAMHNYFFKYISDHLYRDKFKDSDIYSYNHKLIKSYDSHNYDKLLMTASLHSKSLYKFINRSHLFRDRNYSVNIKSSQKYSLRCQKYYMIMFHYQRRYIHYKNKLFSYRKFLINSNKKRNTIRNHLMLLINIYKKDKNFLNNMSMHVRLCYLKYML